MGMSNDMLTIAAFAAEQMITEAEELEVTFVLTQFGPIVQIEKKEQYNEDQ